MTHNNLLNSYISTFLLIFLLYLLRGFLSIQGTESIFEKPTQRIFLLPPCIPKFGRCEHVANPNKPKTRVYRSTWFCNCTRWTASSIDPCIFLFQYAVTLSSEGLAPRFALSQPSPLHPKIRGTIIKNCYKSYLLVTLCFKFITTKR